MQRTERRAPRQRRSMVAMNTRPREGAEIDRRRCSPSDIPTKPGEKHAAARFSAARISKECARGVGLPFVPRAAQAPRPLLRVTVGAQLLDGSAPLKTGSLRKPVGGPVTRSGEPDSPSGGDYPHKSRCSH